MHLLTMHRANHAYAKYLVIKKHFDDRTSSTAPKTVFVGDMEELVMVGDLTEGIREYLGKDSILLRPEEYCDQELRLEYRHLNEELQWSEQWLDAIALEAGVEISQAEIQTVLSHFRIRGLIVDGRAWYKPTGDKKTDIIHHLRLLGDDLEQRKRSGQGGLQRSLTDYVNAHYTKLAKRIREFLLDPLGRVSKDRTEELYLSGYPVDAVSPYAVVVVSPHGRFTV